MMAAQKLVCLAPAPQPKLSLQTWHPGGPGVGQVLVRVMATSVNPIDAKRATGYGRRLLRFKGAASFPLVLGNDLAGVVLSAGPGQSTWQPGDRVHGLIATGPQGAHASHVLADAALLRASPERSQPEALAALPYTFNTLWQALQAVGLNEASARDKAVLVHGASGGLGRLALQVLSRWGARVTAVCSTAHVQTCRDLGAQAVLDRSLQPLSILPCDHDASLNFAAWQDEAALISRLKPDAMGHATTVHPLLASFDEQGWVRGGVQVYRAWSAMRKLAAGKGVSTRYSWVVFSPSAQALDALQSFQPGTGLCLPVGLSVPLAQGQLAFDHVTQQRAGRAILRPE
jgi:D-arabinose 1-dehydrogenase-like Zn-dependent alcohol dehydrogenase